MVITKRIEVAGLTLDYTITTSAENHGKATDHPEVLEVFQQALLDEMRRAAVWMKNIPEKEVRVAEGCR